MSWLSQGLNSLPGLAIVHEPFFQPADPMLMRSWPRTLRLYQEDRLDPQPPGDVTEHLAEMVTYWATTLAPQMAGFKEVAAGWKVPIMVDGLRQADPDTRVILLWRGFEGVLSSWERRGIMWWVTDVWERMAERARSDETVILEAIQPTDDHSKLFAAWLLQNYADMEAVQALGSAGLALKHQELMDGDGPWMSLSAHLGGSQIVAADVREVVTWGNESRHINAVRADTDRARRVHGGWSNDMRRRVLDVIDQVQRPLVLTMLLEV